MPAYVLGSRLVRCNCNCIQFLGIQFSCFCIIHYLRRSISPYVVGGERCKHERRKEFIMGKKVKWFDTVQKILSSSEPDPVPAETETKVIIYSVPTN